MHNRIKALIVAAMVVTNSVSPTLEVLANELEMERVSEEITTTITTEEKTEDSLILDIAEEESNTLQSEETSEDITNLNIEEKSEESSLINETNISEENNNAATKALRKLEIESNTGEFDWGYSTSNEVAILVEFDNRNTKKVLEIELADGMAFNRYAVKDTPSNSVEFEATPTELAVIKDVLDKPTQDQVTGQYSGKLVYELQEGVASGKIVVNVSVDRYKYYDAKTIDKAIKVTVKENDVEVDLKSIDVKAKDNTSIGVKNNSLNNNLGNRTTKLQPGGTGNTYNYYRNTTSTVQTGDNGIRDFTYIKGAELIMYYPVNTTLVSVNNLPSGATYDNYPDENKVVINISGPTIQNSNVSLTYKVDENASPGIIEAPNNNVMKVTYYDGISAELIANVVDSVEVVDPNTFSSVIEMTVQDGYYHDYNGNSLSISGYIYLQDKTVKEYNDQIFEYKFSNWNTRKVLLPDSMTGIKNIKYKLFGDSTVYDVDNSKLVDFQGVSRLIDADALGIDKGKYFEEVTFEVENIPVGFDDSSNGRNNKLAISFGELPTGINEGKTTVKIYPKGNENAAIITEKPIKRVNKPEKIAISSANTSLKNEENKEVSNSFTQKVLKAKTSFDANKGFNRIYNFSNYLENPEIIIRMPKGFHLSTQTIKLTQNGVEKKYTISNHTSAVDGSQIFTLQTEDVKIGGFNPETLAINPAIDVEFDFVTDSTVNGKYNLNDMIFIGKKGSHIDQVYDNSGILVQNDNFDLIKGDKLNGVDRALGRTQTKEFEIIETKELVVTTHIRDYGSSVDKQPYNKDDESTAIQVSKGTKVDFIVKVENNYERPAEDFEVYIPIPKKGVNMGTEVQLGQFNWDMEIEGDPEIVVKDKNGNTTNLADLFEVTYGFNLNGGSSYDANYTTDKDVIRVVAKESIEPGVVAEIKFTFKASDTADQSEVGLLNVFNAYYRRKYDNGTIDIRLPGNYLGLRLAIGEVKGIAFLDNDRDGLFNKDKDTVLDNVSVELFNKSTGALVETKVTNSDGEYKFEGLANGEYEVRVKNNGDSVDAAASNAKRFTKLTSLSGDSYKNDSDIVTADNVNGSISISVPTKSHLHDMNDYVNIGFVNPSKITIKTDGNGTVSGSDSDIYMAWPFVETQYPGTVTANTGYKFVNYTTSTGATFTFPSIVNSDIEITANFEKEIYQVTLDANDGVAGTKTSIEVAFDELIKAGLDLLTDDELPTRTGYKFIGWSTSKDASGLITDTNKMGANPITVYAVWEKEIYQVTLDANNGVDGTKTSIEVAFDESIKAGLDLLTGGELPTRTGYKLVGWATDKAGNNLITDTDKMGETPITVYAVWEKEIYQVTLDANDGVAGTKSEVEITFEDKIKDALDLLTGDELPTRTGYKFIGWSTSKDASGLITDTDKMGANPITVYAVWEKEIYQVTLDANDGVTGTKTSIEVAFDESIKAGLDLLTGDELPTRTGYKFIGWSTTTDKKDLITDTNKMGANPITVYAVWEKEIYQVILDANDGVAGTKTSIEVAFDESIKTGLNSLVGDELPTRTGYKLVGWATDKAGNNLITDADKMGTTAITVYAVWEKEIYQVTIDANDGVAGTKTSIEVVFDESIKAGLDLLTGDELPTRTGYKFVGWSTSKDASGLITDTNKMGANPITVYAVWEKEIYQVTLNANDGVAGTKTSIEVAFDESIKTGLDLLTGDELPTRTGYKLVGWATDKSGNNLITDTDKMGATPITVYAVWEKVEYTITLDANDGVAGTKSEVGVTFEDKIKDKLDSLTADELPTRTGYKFVGWSTSKDTSGLIKDTDTMGASPITVYAVWEKIEYTITLEANDGVAGTKSEIVITFEDKIKDKLDSLTADELPTRTGYKFVGWSISKNESGLITDTDTMGAASITLYAIWDKAPIINGVVDTIIKAGEEFNPLTGITVEDVEEQDLEIKVSGDEVLKNVPGRYEVIYTVIDKAGNITTEKRIVTVYGMPVITGADNVAIKLNSEFKELENVYAEDTLGNPLEVNVIKNTVDVKTPGKYIVVYEVTDAAQNTVTVEREVTVYGTPWIIGTEDKAIKVGSQFDPLDGVVAKDTEGNELKISVIASVTLYDLWSHKLVLTLEGVVKNTVDNIDVYKLGPQKLTYIAEDIAGNIITVDRIITVYGEPIIIEADDVAIKLGSTFNPLDGVIIEDTEGKELTVSVLTNTVDINTPGKYTVTYTAEDVAGHIVTVKRVVTVYGDPVITGADDTTLKVGSEFNPLAGVTAKDTEGKELNISISGDTVDVNKPGKYIVTYTATDDMGNVTTVNRIVIVEAITSSVAPDNSVDKEETKEEEKTEINGSTNSNIPNTGDKGMFSYLLLAMSSMTGLVMSKKRKKK